MITVTFWCRIHKDGDLLLCLVSAWLCMLRVLLIGRKLHVYLYVCIQFLMSYFGSLDCCSCAVWGSSWYHLISVLGYKSSIWYEELIWFIIQSWSMDGRMWYFENVLFPWRGYVSWKEKVERHKCILYLHAMIPCVSPSFCIMEIIVSSHLVNALLIWYWFVSC